MFIILGELNFWTFDNDVDLEETDFGAFSYHDKKIDNVYEEGKRSYAQKRGMVYVPFNKKGNKMKDSIKYLMDQLKDHSTIYTQWADYCTLQIMLSSGLLIYIQVDLCSGDIQKIVFDRFLIGKLSERVSDVIITKSYLICTYNDCQVTLVNFLKPKKSIFEKISRLEPKISTFDICGPSARRLEKKVHHNRAEDLILIWWKCTTNEVYPWSPTVKEHDRANLHLYRLKGAKLELLCYLRTEFDPLSIIFHTNYDNVIHSLEQKVSRKGEVTVEWKTYEVSRNDKLQRIAVYSIPLPTHASCIRFSPNQEKLLLGCIDGSITLHDQVNSVHTTARAAFIPTLACWHCDGTLFSVGNERGQVQHFDIALSCVRGQMLNEDIASSNITDLSTYFRTQPALKGMEWNKKSEPNSFVDFYNHGDSLFLLLFERGPIAIIKMIEGGNFSVDILVQKYLASSQVQQATALLLAASWDSDPHICMNSLNQIVNYLFKQPLTPERENFIQSALGSFHVPVKPMNQAVIDEYGDEVRDLTRRFFHHLLRYKLFEKAFRLAIDLNDHDLFMDIHFYAVVLKDNEMATAAKEKAEEILGQCNSCSSSHSTCSRSSCSLCSDSESNEVESSSSDSKSEESRKKRRIRAKRSFQHKYLKNPSVQAPPLPVLYAPISNDLESTSFNEMKNETDVNSMSTAFPVQNDNLALSLNNCPIPKLATESYLMPVSDVAPAVNNIDNTNQIQQAKDLDKLRAPFQSLTLSQQLTPIVAQSSLNSMSLENITNSYPISNFIPYNFNSAQLQPNSISSELTHSLSNKLDTISTSFNSPSTFTESFEKNDTYVDANFDIQDKRVSGLTVLKSNVTDTQCVISKPLDTNELNESAITVKPITSICNESPTHTIFTSGNDLMSTSFNDPDDLNDDANSNSCDSSSNSNSNSKQASVSSVPPPPPLITDTLANYINYFPRRNFVLSRSTTGLSSLDDSILKFPNNKPLHAPLQQPQNYNANLIQNRKNDSIQSTCNYALNYDLDYIPFRKSCDSLTNLHSNIHQMKTKSSNNLSDFDNKYSKSGSSQIKPQSHEIREHRQSSNVPPLPVISPCPTEKSCPSSLGPMDAVSAISDKPKVKFSDTVTHILVPKTAQTHRSIQKRSMAPIYPVDPRQELAESLPLCLGNEDYLKTFQPLSRAENEKVKETVKADGSSKIKVVHFGLL
ncbi:hypothetical protein QAD02_004748 [Eretmocerus hayati]|uniref:Uncharacterized protein n=1 Tax=Eretmocerus hayati TaxID=131215 RepID=A0ACC2NRH5_9HYME|nr:hypothetical protein QAD02_004748 [Eretmocerus hayati]